MFTKRHVTSLTNRKLAVFFLTAPTRAPTTHTPVTTPIPGHDRPTDMAAWRVAQVDKLFQRVGRMIQTAIDDGRRALHSRGRLRSKSTLRRSRFTAGLAEC